MREGIVVSTGQGKRKSVKVVYYILGLFEVLFGFRLIFKLLGANPESTLVVFIYSMSEPLLSPFTGVFRSAVTQGIEVQSALEPTTVIAMIVCALIAWGIVKLIEINRAPRDTRNW